MLLLKRKEGERVFINGRQIQIVVVETGPGWAKLGFIAPDDVVILREELQIDEERERGEEPAKAPQNGATPGKAHCPTFVFSRKGWKQ